MYEGNTQIDDAYRGQQYVIYGSNSELGTETKTSAYNRKKQKGKTWKPLPKQTTLSAFIYCTVRYATA